MKVKCDLHIHSALSPCGDMDMTPNNIVNMAQLNGLDVIAVTDHNTAGNVRAVMECAKGTPLCVVPGMELETAEEAHFVCLFETADLAEEFSEYIKEFALPIENRVDIFGEQAYMDAEDNITGHESRLLTTALTASVYDLLPEVERLGGVMIPAHVDKDSYSIISNLGMIPEDLGFRTAEISKNTTFSEAEERFPYLADYLLITDSDAHYIWDMYEEQNVLELEEKSISCLLEALRKGK